MSLCFFLTAMINAVQPDCAERKKTTKGSVKGTDSLRNVEAKEETAARGPERRSENPLVPLGYLCLPTASPGISESRADCHRQRYGKARHPSFQGSLLEAAHLHALPPKASHSPSLPCLQRNADTSSDCPVGGKSGFRSTRPREQTSGTLREGEREREGTATTTDLDSRIRVCAILQQQSERSWLTMDRCQVGWSEDMFRTLSTKRIRRP